MGYNARQYAAKARPDHICACGHERGQHQELQSTFAIVGNEIVETPHPDYQPLVEYCKAEECSCKIDHRGKKSTYRRKDRI